MDQNESRPIPRTQSKPLIVFSRIASFVFHPFVITTVAAIAIYKLSPGAFYYHSFKEIRLFIEKLALFTILFLFLSVLIFRKAGLISNTRMHQPADRILPLFAAFIF